MYGIRFSCIKNNKTSAYAIFPKLILLIMFTKNAYLIQSHLVRKLERNGLFVSRRVQVYLYASNSKNMK